MRYLVVFLSVLLSVLADAASFSGTERDGYFYPDFQVWTVTQVARLSPVQVDHQLSGVPLMLLNSQMFFAPNFFTMKSANSGGELVFPACFVQNGDHLQAHILSDGGRRLIGEYFDFRFANNGLVYLSWGGYFQLAIKPERQFDATVRPRFENIVVGLQNMKELLAAIDSAKLQAANKPEQLSRLDRAKKLMFSLLQRDECAYIEPKNMFKHSNLMVSLPQLNKRLQVVNGLRDVGENIVVSNESTRHKQPRSVEYRRKSYCISNILFSSYTSGDHDGEIVITEGFIGSRDSQAAATAKLNSEIYTQWFLTHLQLTLADIKLQPDYMDELTNQAMLAGCHRELYRKRLDIGDILSQFDGVNGFVANKSGGIHIQNANWLADDLLELVGSSFRLTIYNKSANEVVVRLVDPSLEK